jgi:hypothetical protein
MAALEILSSFEYLKSRTWEGAISIRSMKRLRLFGSMGAIVIALSVVMGLRERGQAEASGVAPLEAPVATVAFPAAIVTAAKPSLSDILDLVLRERPTAAELGGPHPSDSFPSGSDEAYVAGILRRYNSDRNVVNRISTALVREGRKRNIGTQLLVGVLLTENPWLDPRARSSVGARGLMQVMPFHAGKWGCGSGDLFDIEANICHGVAVLADNLNRSPNLKKALLGYNGCVRGTNTPDCWRYPSHVYRRGKLGN